MERRGEWGTGGEAPASEPPIGGAPAGAAGRTGGVDAVWETSAHVVVTSGATWDAARADAISRGGELERRNS